MPGAVKVRKCVECGAELRHDVTKCPLCGADAAARGPRRAAAPTNVDDYQRDVRALRRQLKKLRDGGAEAV
jgi:hypothetical protein